MPASDPTFVTANDRTFTCTESACDGVGGPRRVREQLGLVDLDATFLDIDLIRDNLSALIASVSEAVSDVFRWIERMEHDFALRYAANEITGDISLFNQINVTLVKLKRMKSMLDVWLKNFHNLILDTSELTNEYGIAVSVLRSESLPSSANLLQNAIALAKRNVSKSRSVNKQIKRILKFDNLIKNNLVKLRSQVESFYTGVIKVNDKLLHLKDLERTILALSDNDSPLKQIQSRLAADINSRQHAFSVNSVQPETIYTPETNCVYDMCQETGPENVEKLIDRLKLIRDRVLYTENTKSQLDRLIDSTVALTKDSVRFPQIKRLCDEIRSRTPSRVIDYYRLNVRNADGQFLRLNNLKELIANLHSSDLAYRPLLQDIRDEMERDISREIETSESSQQQLDVDPGVSEA